MKHKSPIMDHADLSLSHASLDSGAHFSDWDHWTLKRMPLAVQVCLGLYVATLELRALTFDFLIRILTFEVQRASIGR